MTPIFEGHLCGVNLITGLAVSFPTLENSVKTVLSHIQSCHTCSESPSGFLVEKTSKVGNTHLETPRLGGFINLSFPLAQERQRVRAVTDLPAVRLQMDTCQNTARPTRASTLSHTPTLTQHNKRREGKGGVTHAPLQCRTHNWYSL